MKHLLLLLLASAALLCSCAGGEPASTDPPQDSQTEIPENTEITVDELSSYIVVRPQSASKELVSATVPFAAKLRALSPQIRYTDDFIMEGSDEYKIRAFEILIGATNRPESTEYINRLCANDFGWAIFGDKIVIAGATEELTILAVEAFTETVLGSDFPDGVFLTSDEGKCLSLEYKWAKSVDEQLLIGENSRLVSDFHIVYNANGTANEKAIAEAFADIAAHNVRYHPSVHPETRENSGFAEIRFNPADAPVLSEDEYGIFWDGYNISVCGGRESLLRRAVTTLILMMDEAAETGKPLLLAENTVYTRDTSPLTAMSFNIYTNFNDDVRHQRVIDIIEKYDPDTLGVQEAHIAWMHYLEENLSDDYAWVGVGRQGGELDEFSSIFYKESVFELLDSGTKWYSNTPDKVSKYGESACYRIFTYAHLRRKSDKSEVMVVNTHLDHVGAREKQAKVLADFLKDYNDMALVLTGDFNTTAGSVAYRNVLSGGVVNAMGLAETKSEGPTYTNFGSYGQVIDYIFVTEEYIAVDSYKVCGEKINGGYPSDHHPVVIEYTVQ